MALAIDVQTRDHGQHVALKGRLDSDTSPQLEEVVSPWIDNESHDGTLLASNLQPQVQKVFDIVKAMPSVNVFTSIRELDEYLDVIQKKVTGEIEE